MSLGDVGEALRRVLVKIDQAIAAHHEAADLAEQARDLLSLAGFGTLQADVDQSCALFTRVIEGISEPEGQVSTLATVADEIRSYLSSQGIGQETRGAAPSPQRPAPGSPDHVEALRKQLPPPVQRATGQKTHGRGSLPAVAR